MTTVVTQENGVGRATLHHLGGAEGLPDLLLIHGFGSDRFSWSATAPGFFNTHRVWAVELPGHTSAPVDHGSGDTHSMALAVANAVDKLSAPFSVVGHSLGGAVAVELATMRPDLISALVLIAPASLGARTNVEFLTAFPRLTSPDEAQSLLELLVSRPKLIGPQMVGHVLGFLDQPGRRDALIEIGNRLSLASSLPLPQGLAVVAIWGQQDVINPPSEATVGLFGERAHVLEGVGHMPHVELARKTNSIIADAIVKKPN